MKKLYRIRKEHKIAGVCSGLGEYFLVDPVFFRIIFLILIIGFGIGFLVYIIMWVIVPLNNQMELSGQIRRLYLAENDKKMAGVCAGLGQYFDIDPVIFRVLFLVGAFAGGIGIIAYIIMFMIVPKNKSYNPNV
ncbi:MAG: PspC domain-containing protein [Candidatus Omnitrophota bacterium]